MPPVKKEKVLLAQTAGFAFPSDLIFKSTPATTSGTSDQISVLPSPTGIPGIRGTLDTLKQRIWYIVNSSYNPTLLGQKINLSSKNFTTGYNPTLPLGAGAVPLPTWITGVDIQCVGNGYMSWSFVEGASLKHCFWNEGVGGMSHYQVIAAIGASAVVHAIDPRGRYIFLVLDITSGTPYKWKTIVCTRTDEHNLEPLGDLIQQTDLAGATYYPGDIIIAKNGDIYVSICSSSWAKLYRTKELKSNTESDWELIGTINGDFSSTTQCFDTLGRLIWVQHKNLTEDSVVVGQRQADGTYSFPFAPVRIATNGSNNTFSKVICLPDGTLMYINTSTTGHRYSRKLQQNGLQAGSANGLWVTASAL